MQTHDAVESKRKKWQFAGIYIITLILIIIAFTAFLIPGPAITNREINKDSARNNLWDASIVLQEKWFELQDLKDQEESKSGLPKAQVVETKEFIKKNKEDFKRSLDSVEVITNKNESNPKAKELGGLISSYRKALEKDETERRIIDTANDDVNMATAAGAEVAKKNNRIAELEKQLVDLKQSILSEGHLKDNRIKELEKQLEISKANGNSNAVANTDNSTKETNFLKFAVRSQVQEIKKLKETNADLQKSNAKLNAQVADLKKYLQ